jgi:hypothetical protein
MSNKNALPKRSENYSEWYNDLVKRADLAENSAVRGCMVIKPYGYSIWEKMQQSLDKRFKETGHTNAYFPLFVPKSFLEKEAADFLDNILNFTEKAFENKLIAFYNHAGLQKLDVKDIATLFNINREIFSSSKAIILATKDFKISNSNNGLNLGAKNNNG